MTRIIVLLLCVSAGLCRLTAADGLIFSLPNPDYPKAAVKQRLQGTVTVRIAYQDTGAVQSVRLLHSSGCALLDRHTTNFILKNWNVPPQAVAYLMQKTGRAWVDIPISYQMNNSGSPKASH